MEKTENFKLGDIVYLNSSPHQAMTIVSFLETSVFDVWCQWIDRKGKLETSGFLLSSLVKQEQSNKSAKELKPAKK
jgi:uncharacterized protein YodC (DUF2158 family)